MTHESAQSYIRDDTASFTDRLKNGGLGLVNVRVYCVLVLCFRHGGTIYYATTPQEKLFRWSVIQTYTI